MSKIRIVLSLSALVFGLGILGLSLTTATAAESATTSMQASSRQLYWDGQVLPDHVAYPVLMALDRAKLEAASPSERIFIQVEFANRRLEYSQELLDKENTSLAITTLTKAYKYLIRAAQETLDGNMPSSVAEHVIKALEYHNKQLGIIKTQVPDSDRAVLDQLMVEGDVLLKRLQVAQEAHNAQQ
jgi:hypothetical protein